MVNSKYRKYLRTPAKACCEKTCRAVGAADDQRVVIAVGSAIARTARIQCSVISPSC